MTELRDFKEGESTEQVLTIIETPQDVEVLVVTKEKKTYLVKSLCLRLGVCTLLGIILFIVCFLVGFGLLDSLYLFIGWILVSNGIVLLLYIIQLWTFRSKRRTSNFNRLDLSNSELL